MLKYVKMFDKVFDDTVKYHFWTEVLVLKSLATFDKTLILPIPLHFLLDWVPIIELEVKNMILCAQYCSKHSALVQVAMFQLFSPVELKD